MTSIGRLRTRILLGATFLLALNGFAVLANRHMALAGDVDFRALYAAGALVCTGRASSIYDYDVERRVQNSLIEPRSVALPFLYPPYAALPFAPLSRLPYRAAYLAFLTINLALLAIASVILRPYVPALVRIWPPLTFILFLCFLPVAIALFQGQVSIILLMLFCFSYAALEKGRSFLAGVVLAFAMIKFHVVLPVVLLFFCWRAWRLVAGFLTGASFVLLLSLAVTGPGGLRHYAQSLTDAAITGEIGAQTSDQASYNVFAAQMPNLQGITFALIGPVKLSTAQISQTPWPTLFVIILSAVIFLYTALQPPSLPRALVTGLLISYHLHLHDLTLLLLPLSLTINQILAARETTMERILIGEPRAGSPIGYIPVLTAFLWILAPLHLLLMATGWKSLFAPLMLPLLFNAKFSERARFSTARRDPPQELTPVPADGVTPSS